MKNVVVIAVFEGIPRECYGRGKRLLVDEYKEVKGMPIDRLV